jgi:mercuric ion transport protein
MRDPQLLGIGIVGTVIAALCCFTPVLVVILGAVGLSAAVGWLDHVLLPALASQRRCGFDARVHDRPMESCGSRRSLPLSAIRRPL